MNELVAAKIINKLIHILSESAGYILPFEPVLLKLALKPRQLNFETTNICNANCIFCGYRFMKRPKGIMPMEIFNKSLKDFIDIGGGSLGFTPPVGDPFMDPLLLQRIRVARDFEEIKTIGLFTNGISLDRFVIRDILNSGINEMIISFDGFSRDEYKRIFGVDEFEHVYQNIINLALANNELQHPIKILLSLRIHKPLKEIMKSPAYGKLANIIVDNISYIYKFGNWSGHIKQEFLIGLMRLKRVARKSEPCSLFYADGPTVLYNGDVTVCGCWDLDGDPELILGNIMKDSLISLWHSDKLKKLRANSYKGIMPKICLNCSYYNNLKIYRRLYFRRLAEVNYKMFCASNYSRRIGRDVSG